MPARSACAHSAHGRLLGCLSCRVACLAGWLPACTRARLTLHVWRLRQCSRTVFSLVSGPCCRRDALPHGINYDYPANIEGNALSMSGEACRMHFLPRTYPRLCPPLTTRFLRGCGSRTPPTTSSFASPELYPTASSTTASKCARPGPSLCFALHSGTPLEGLVEAFAARCASWFGLMSK